MTGGNFAIAETGTFMVCTNEGNADIGASVRRFILQASVLRR